MKDSGSIHKKVQDMCDCYATNDPLKEMSRVKDNADKSEAALKWLALAALHGVNNNARKVSLKRSSDGDVTVMAEYKKTDLPSPGAQVGDKIFEAIREVTHIEGEKGKTALALGVRGSSLELQVKLKSKDGGDKVTIEFPE